jgi:hypothetical protein
MSQELYEELELIYSMNYDYKRFWLLNVNKLITTNVSKMTLEKFTKKINSKKTDDTGKDIYFDNELRFLMFSGHDDNVWPFMVALGLTSSSCLQKKYKEIYIDKKEGVAREDPNCRIAPSYASSVIFELNYVAGEAKDKEFYVKVKFNGKDIDLTSKCQNTINNVYCPFSEFNTWLEKDFILTPDIFAQVCRPFSSDSNSSFGW